MPRAVTDHLRGAAERARWLPVAMLVIAAEATAFAGAAVDAGAPPDVIAQARAYEHGEGVPKDPIRAAKLYCAAARDGNPEAQFDLGWMYANGRGVAHDDEIAASLFALAAAAGHAEAKRMQRFVGRGSGSLPDCMRPPPAPVTEEAEAPVEPDPFADLPPWKQKIADQVEKLAPRYAVDPRLALSIIAVESNFEPRARSVKDARGLMQLIPETASRFNVANPYDVLDNLRGGLAYLRWLLAYYQGQVALAVAAYNAGEAAVDRYRGVPPYPETRDYVDRVLQMFRRDWHAFDARVVAPSVFLAAPGTVAR
jgi:TPR repeat protein